MRNVLFAIIVLALGALAVARPGNGSNREVMLYVNEAPVAWADPGLEEALVRNATRHRDVRIALPHRLPSVAPAFPADVYHLDSLVNWGVEVNARYLALVLVDGERLERRKTIHLPLIFHKYSTLGVIHGELRVIDVSRERLLIAEPFIYELEAAAVFQGTMDDDPNDPDLHVRASDKTRFFRQLEDECSAMLIKRIGAVIRMR